jgi:hypothetical protein
VFDDEAAPQHDDAVVLRAEFNKPAYVALFTLDTNGVVTRRLVPPEGPSGPVKQLIYPPADPTGRPQAYPLTDGAGLQCILLLVSDDPIASAGALEQKLRRHWQELPPSSMWSYTDGRFELPSGTRSNPRLLAVVPEPFEKICREAQALAQGGTVRAIAFPVTHADEDVAR